MREPTCLYKVAKTRRLHLFYPKDTIIQLIIAHATRKGLLKDGDPPLNQFDTYYDSGRDSAYPSDSEGMTISFEEEDVLENKLRGT